MIITLKELYKRFNQFGDDYNGFQVRKSVTMAKIYKEYLGQDIILDRIIFEYEKEYYKAKAENTSLYLENQCIQPKSITFRLLLLELVLDSIPNRFYNKVNIDKNSLLGITYSIVLYYIGLQTEFFSDVKMNNTEKRNLLRSIDFSFSLSDIILVRGNTEDRIFEKYIKLFSVSINELEKNEEACLFSDENKSFIFCIEDFVDYIIFEVEKKFKEICTKDENDVYTKRKGELFEKLVFEVLSLYFKECFHTVYYFPNKCQKNELDVMVRDKKDIGIIECKSGTFDISNINTDDAIKLQIRNKTKKAYKTLKTVSEYLLKNREYEFSFENETIKGEVENTYLIHVSMYSMDFISSSLHALIEEYLNEDNPILSISLEHLLAIIIDLDGKDYSLLDYWKKRKEYIVKHPHFFYDNNELDLFYELMHEESMLNEMEKTGFLDQINPQAKLTSSFHNQYGEEIRPASDLIRNLDSKGICKIIQCGKTKYGLNKRYLKNLDDYLRLI